MKRSVKVGDNVPAEGISARSKVKVDERMAMRKEERGGLYSKRVFLRITTGETVAMGAKWLAGIRGM